MAGNPHDRDEGDPLALARRIHLACEQFEAEWRNDRRPRIEVYLGSCTDDDRCALLSELLALELELRCDHGEQPGRDEYLRRFPGFDQAIGAAFGDSPPVIGGSQSTIAWRPPESGPACESNSGRGSMPTVEERLGDYVLIEEIARGGMGVVYRARQVSLDRTVALKMILSGTLATPEERARFRREAELAGKLDHANIVPIYEVREQEGVLFFSMKLIDGGNLAQRTRCTWATPGHRPTGGHARDVPCTTPTARGSFIATSSHRTS